MEKELSKLMVEYPEDIKKVVIDLYNEKYSKSRSKNTVCHFRVLGKSYDSDKFVDNYLQFISDIIRICGYDSIKESIKECYISKSKNTFSTNCNNKNQIREVADGVYLNTYSPTSVKISHIEKICSDLLVGLQRTL
jgi:hypothetical protein